PRARASRRSGRRSSRLPSSGSRTPSSRRGSLGFRCSLVREDLAETGDVDLAQLALAVLEPADELGTQDVDLAVKHPAAERELVLLLLQALDQRLQVCVVEL